MKNTSVVLEPQISSLPLLAKGKVRNNYAVGEDKILMVASDRLSAFDVIMNQGIPGKGILLTQMALFWFNHLKDIVPNHLTQTSPETVVTTQEIPQVQGRSMLVKRLKPILVESVVRGYITGSGWKEYQTSQTICGITLPSGLRHADQLPTPIFTPAAKAPAGNHDENITFEDMSKRIGTDLATKIRDTSITLYQKAADFALSKGIIIADTKFEFGLDDNDQLTLMDEILTPDSSRYWPIEGYQQAHAAGTIPPSYDKQFVRDWLESIQIDGSPWNKQAPAPDLPNEIIEKTYQKYQEVYQRLCV